MILAEISIYLSNSCFAFDVSLGKGLSCSRKQKNQTRTVQAGDKKRLNIYRFRH